MRELASPISRTNFSILSLGKIGDQQAKIQLNLTDKNGFIHPLATIQVEGQSQVAHCIKKGYEMAAKNCVMEAKQLFKTSKDKGEFDKEELFSSCIQCMSDSNDIRGELIALRSSPIYNSDNFSHCSNNKDNSTFTAHFKTGETLILSNRDSGTEMRGDNLKKALTNNSYKNLEELVTNGYLTEDDTRLKYTLNSAKLNLLATIEHAGMQHPVVTQLLHNTPIASTTLGKLFGLPEPSIVNTDGLQQCQTTTKGDRIQKALTEDTQAGLAKLTAEIHNSKASSHSLGGFRLFS